MDSANKFPVEYIKRIKDKLGDESSDFFSSQLLPPFISVRINPHKPNINFDSFENVSWCKYGKYLPMRPSFTFDPLFHAGTYYVQEPSSMFLSEIFRQAIGDSKKINVLDLCAAPGGKSTLILGEILPESLLVTNETIMSRVSPLLENIMKWGLPNVLITNNNADDFLQLRNYFDVIVVDAPCSGEGLFRKDENAIKEWSESNVKLCSARQKKILSRIWNCLKPGGILIYSTCTFSEEENEENVKFIAGQEIFDTIRINLKEESKIVESLVPFGNNHYYSYRFYPHKVKGEGFFVACFKKNQEKSKAGSNFRQRFSGNKIKKITRSEIPDISGWIKNPMEYEIVHWENYVYAIKKEHWEDLIFLSGILNIRSFGICLGKVINGNLIPSHDLALSIIISEKIQSVELNESQSLKYLKREEIPEFKTELKGWTLVKYSGFILGWIKILENRINNYLPKQFRILKNL